MVPVKSEEEKSKEEKEHIISYAQDVLKDATDYSDEIQKQEEDRDYSKKSLLEKAGMADSSQGQPKQEKEVTLTLTLAQTKTTEKSSNSLDLTEEQLQ